MDDKTAKQNGINWLSEQEYQKAVGQLRLQLNGVMRPLLTGVTYGQQPFVLQAIEEIIKLSEDFGLRVRGMDHPIIFKQPSVYH